jgi:hypothetical protein
MQLLIFVPKNILSLTAAAGDVIKAILNERPMTAFLSQKIYAHDTAAAERLSADESY